MNMRVVVAAAVGLALFAWTVASVGATTLVAQIGQLGIMLPLVLVLAGMRFALQAAGWRLAMRSPVRPTLLQAFRAVVAGEAAGYLTWGPISREPVKALMVSDQTPERVSLAAAIVERIAYMGAATALVALSLVLVALRTNRGGWLLPGFAVTVAIGGLVAALRRKWLSEPFSEGTGVKGSRSYFALGALAVLQEIINVFETYAVLAWLGAGPTFESAIALEGLNRLANAPAQLIPGKLGVLELAGSAFAGILRLGPANGLTLILARRVRSLAWTGAGILLLTTSASRARAMRREPAII